VDVVVADGRRLAMGASFMARAGRGYTATVAGDAL